MSGVKWKQVPRTSKEADFCGLDMVLLVGVLVCGEVGIDWAEI